jgi:hypothetical protein
MKKLLFKGVFVLTIFLMSCHDDVKNKCGGESATLKNYKGLSCCGWVIKLQDGEVIQPVNLSSFISDPTDGQEIYVSFHDTSLVNCCMAGATVQLDCLEKK